VKIGKNKRRPFGATAQFFRAAGDYWKSFIALISVCNTPSVSGMPTKPEASARCRVVVPPRFLVAMIVSPLACRKLAAAGQTIMLVEQNLAATLALADRAYIINNDHIVYEGPAQEIKARPEILHRHLGV